MVKMTMVSNPVVTAVESICIALDFTPSDFIMRFAAALNEVPNKRGTIGL